MEHRPESSGELHRHLSRSFERSLCVMTAEFAMADEFELDDADSASDGFYAACRWLRRAYEGCPPKCNSKFSSILDESRYSGCRITISKAERR